MYVYNQQALAYSGTEELLFPNFNFRNSDLLHAQYIVIKTFRTHLTFKSNSSKTYKKEEKRVKIRT